MHASYSTCENEVPVLSVRPTVKFYSFTANGAVALNVGADRVISQLVRQAIETALIAAFFSVSHLGRTSNSER